MGRAPAVALVVGLAGCGFLGAGLHPVVEAHRGAAGYWPQNSRTAMRGSIAAGYEGLEFDLVLTADDVPVLSHDAWLHETLCTLQDGTALDGRILLRDLTLEAVLAGYTCGGVPDPENPDAEVVAETVMTFDELLAELAEAEADLVVHIDVKYLEGATPEPEVIAPVVLQRWWDADLPQPWYVSADHAGLLLEFRRLADEAGEPIVTSLIWPYFPPDGSDTLVALEAEALAMLGVEDLEDLADDAEADGIAIPWQILDRRQVELARRRGLEVQAWTLNDEDLLTAFSAWPLDALITDYPGRAP